MAKQDERFYIEQVLNGDTAAFSALVDKHKQMVFTIVVKILRNREDAEETAQDVFVKAYQKLKTFRGTAKFSTWLYRIAYTTAISKSRKKKSEFTAIDEDMIDNYTIDTVSRNVNELSREEQIAAVNCLMEKLPAEENLLLTLFYKNEKTIDDISTITGYSASNVKVKLYRIRKRMYDELKNQLNL